jgi:hypothetical protein
MSYVLDLVVHEVESLEHSRSIKTDVFLEFTLDGIGQPFKVQPLPPASHLRWDAPVRLTLNATAFLNSFLFAALATTDPSGAKIALARAKFPLKGFPVGRPKKFRFPLMSTSDTSVCLAQAHITAWLSALVPYRSGADSGFPMSNAQTQTGRGQYWSAPP